MMRPSRPAPSCIIAHPQPLFAVFTTRFDRPTPPAHGHQCFPSGVPRSMTPGDFQLPCLAVSTQHHPDRRPRQRVSHRHRPHESTIRPHRALAPCCDGLACPRRDGQRPGHLPHCPRRWGARHQALPLRATTTSTPRRDVGGWARFPDPCGVGYVSTIPQAQPCDPIQKGGIPLTRLVCHHPPTPQRLAACRRTL